MVLRDISPIFGLPQFVMPYTQTSSMSTGWNYQNRFQFPSDEKCSWGFKRGKSANSFWFTLDQSWPHPVSFLQLGNHWCSLKKCPYSSDQLEWHLEARKPRMWGSCCPSNPVTLSWSCEFPWKCLLVTQSQSYCFYKGNPESYICQDRAFTYYVQRSLPTWNLQVEDSLIPGFVMVTSTLWTLFFSSPKWDSGNPFGVVGRLEIRYVGINSWSLFHCAEYLFLHQENNSCSFCWIFFLKQDLKKDA